MKRKLKKYKVGMDSETYAISLVESPAIEEELVALEKQEPIKIQLANDEKHMVYSAVLIPDKSIYRRNEDGDEYYLEFSKESIEKMSQEFMKEYRQAEITVDHEDIAPEITVVESWIKADLYKDKSVALGLNEQLPIGTWFAGMKVNNIDVWDRIKSGELKGFSVESMVSLEEFEKQDNNMNIETNDMGFWNKMKSILQEVFTSAALAKQDPPLDEGTEINQEVEEAKLENVTMEEETPPTEPNPEHTEAVEEVKVEDTKEEQTETNPEPPEEPKPNPLEDLVRNLTEEIKALKESNEGLNKKIKNLEKTPSTQPVNTNAKPSSKDTYSAWRNQMAKMLGY